MLFFSFRYSLNLYVITGQSLVFITYKTVNDCDHIFASFRKDPTKLLLGFYPYAKLGIAFFHVCSTCYCILNVCTGNYNLTWRLEGHRLQVEYNLRHSPP